MICLMVTLSLYADFDVVDRPVFVDHSVADDLLLRQQVEHAKREAYHAALFDRATDDYRAKKAMLDTQDLTDDERSLRLSQLDKKLQKKRAKIDRQATSDKASLELTHQQERDAAMVDVESLHDVQARARARANNVLLEHNLHDRNLFSNQGDTDLSEQNLSDQVNLLNMRMTNYCEQHAQADPKHAQEWQRAARFLHADIARAKQRIVQEELEKARRGFASDEDVEAALLHMKGTPPYSTEHVEQAYEQFEEKVRDVMGDSIQADELLRLFARERDKLVQDVKEQEKRQAIKDALPDKVKKALTPQELERFVDLLSRMDVGTDAFKTAQLGAVTDIDLGRMTEQTVLTIVTEYKDVINTFKKPEVREYIRGLWDQLSPEQQKVIRESFSEAVRRHKIDIKGLAAQIGSEALSAVMVGALIRVLMTVL